MNENLNNNNETQNNYTPQSNYYEPEKNNGVKVLLIILIILVLVLIGIFSYKIFVLDKKDTNKNNTTPTEEKGKTKTEEISSEMAALIEKQVKEFPYIRIIKGNISHDELFTSIAIDSALKNLRVKEPANDAWVDETDETEAVKKLAEALGLTKDEISKINIDLWKENLLGGSTYRALYDMNSVREEISKLYKNYKYNLVLNDTISLSCAYIVYDKNVDKIIFASRGCIAGDYVSQLSILDKSLDNGVYKVRLVEAGFTYRALDGSNSCYILDKDSNKKKVNCVENEDAANSFATSYISTHKDELPQYEMSFKIDGNSYEFIDIKKVN